MTFVDAYLAGKATPEDVHNFIEQWHLSKGTTLAEFLGLTSDEYAIWVSKPDCLQDILNAYRGIPTETVMLNFGDVKITFLDEYGRPLKPGGEARSHRFIIEGAGIDPMRVKRVEIPPLDYSSPELLTIKVEMYLFSKPDCEGIKCANILRKGT